jgi:hypothetical protein
MSVVRKVACVRDTRDTIEASGAVLFYRPPHHPNSRSSNASRGDTPQGGDTFSRESWEVIGSFAEFSRVSALPISPTPYMVTVS